MVKFTIWLVKVWRRYNEQADYFESEETFGVGTLEEAIELKNEIEAEEREDWETGFLDCYTVDIERHEYERKVKTSWHAK